MKLSEIKKDGNYYSPWKTLHQREDIDLLKRGELFPPKDIQVDLEAYCPHSCEFCSYRNVNWQSHGMDFAEEFGPSAFLMRARKEGLRDFGACMNPTNAFHIMQGIETLPMRMQRHMDNTRVVVAFLDQHDAVDFVTYPELPGHPDHALAKKLLPKGSGAVFSFELKGGREAGRKFIDSLRLFSHLANVGDAKSLVIHPASTTHSRMDADALKAAGVSVGLVRLSVGIEDPKDLVDDLGRALHRSQR